MFYVNQSNTFFNKWKKRLQYISDNCSLRVVGYVITPTRVSFLKRIFWLLIIAACCFGSASVLRGALNLYTTESVSYSVETNYLEFDTPFPAITICQEITESYITKFLKANNLSLNLLEFVKDVSVWNPKYCKSCLTCKFGQTCVADFLDIVHKIRKNCSELLTHCSWNDETFPCCKRFQPIETEYGLCFVFNSHLNDQKTIYTVNRYTGLSGLIFEAIEDVKLRVHASDDMVCVATSIASEKVLSSCDKLLLISEFNLLLSAEQTYSDVSVQRLSQSKRDCLFYHERPEFAHLWPFKRYSYSTCLLYCTAITQAEVCNCSHHYMPKIGDIPRCDIEGLICLYKNKDLLNIDHFDCPMSCEEMMYKVVHVTCPRQIGKAEKDDIDSHGTVGRIRLSQLPSMRVRRLAIRDLLGLVVDIGGVIGVFFGASLLSFFEIFYLIFIRRYR